MDGDLLTFITNTGVPTLLCLVLLKQNREYVKAIRSLSNRIHNLEKILKVKKREEKYEEDY